MSFKVGPAHFDRQCLCFNFLLMAGAFFYGQFGITAVAELPAKGAVLELNWSSCVNQMAQSNPELRGAMESLKQSQLQEQAAHAGYLPSLSLSMGRERMMRPTYDEPATTYLAQFELSQNIFSGFGDRYKLEQAQQSILVAKENLRQVSARLTATLKQTIANWIYSNELVFLSEKILEQRKANIKNVMIRFKGGAEHLGSLQQAEAYLLQAKFELLSAQENLALARMQIKTLLGLNTTRDISWTGDVPKFEIPSLSQLEGLVTETSEYKQAIAEEKSAMAGVGSARSGFYPSLDLSANVGKTDEFFFPQGTRWTVGVTLTWSLFNGFKDSTQLQIAKSKSLSAQYDLSSKSLSILSTLQQRRSELRLAIEKIGLEEKFRDAAQLRAEIAEKKYVNGILSFDDWDQVESERIQHQKSILSSHLDLRNSEANLEKILGKGAWE